LAHGFGHDLGGIDLGRRRRRASAWPLLQAVMTLAMTTMAMAERPARSDAGKEWRYGTSVPLDLQ